MKIRGKVYYFGSDADEALRRYLAEKDHRLAGIDREIPEAGETIEWPRNAFMDSARLSYRQFTEEFKRDAVQVLRNGHPAGSVVERLG